jgi:hypothetical protein
MNSQSALDDKLSIKDGSGQQNQSDDGPDDD